MGLAAGYVWRQDSLPPSPRKPMAKGLEMQHLVMRNPWSYCISRISGAEHPANCTVRVSGCQTSKMQCLSILLPLSCARAIPENGIFEPTQIDAQLSAVQAANRDVLEQIKPGTFVSHKRTFACTNQMRHPWDKILRTLSAPSFGHLFPEWMDGWQACVGVGVCGRRGVGTLEIFPLLSSDERKSKKKDLNLMLAKIFKATSPPPPQHTLPEGCFLPACGQTLSTTPSLKPKPVRTLEGTNRQAHFLLLHGKSAPHMS